MAPRPRGVAAARRADIEQRVEADLEAAIDLLNLHHRSFQAARPFAERTGHTVPSDTKSWSQVLVSLLSGIGGRGRRKGSDLSDGSDVKAANVWCAIDTPRFNGCAPAGRTTAAAIRPEDIAAFNDTPHLYLVLWDERLPEGIPRCRVWVVRPQRDRAFRRIVAEWYRQRREGEITSTNFQLHPPRNRNDNVVRNLCGNLEYPLLFCAERVGRTFAVTHYDAATLDSGACRRAR